MALTQSEFIERCTGVHQNFYDYSTTVYNKAYEDVDIICPLHGKFTQIARNHMIGKGCPECGTARMAQKSRQKAAQKFVEEARSVSQHVGKGYSYKKTVYKTSKEKVVITCLVHGDFSITPHNHLNGQGCRKCASERRTKRTFKSTSEAVLSELENGFTPYKAGILYILKCQNMIKIGISNNDARYRCDSVSKTSGFDFKVRTVYMFDSGRIAQIVETEILRLLRKTYKQPSYKFDGYTETFLDVDMPYLLHNIELLLSVIEGQNSPQSASQEA
jgi:hypothetical protein